ncbi:hypothetical protein NU688_33155 [Variovorax sp. ZS18.2.2]|uniref:hypothetical protein n=1 Tax=Variovorax sp. ZS18.2.2 TaxID=2971255 RepID=UPI002150E962|nr:hypothetical protein [Variovorax sp. ZS18.2.2]MCR6481047.1 hypothetical protein [Variovorax sp. ZS18.2.2]
MSKIHITSTESIARFVAFPNHQDCVVPLGLLRRLVERRVEPGLVYTVSDHGYSGEQLAKAVEVCAMLSMAYAYASEDNGGAGSIRWEGIDQPAALADEVMHERMTTINAWARQENGLPVDRSN